jgi:hypothetical protein
MSGPALSTRSGKIPNTELLLRLAAPYLAVGVFWCLLHNAWLTILAYHAQILWWARGSSTGLRLRGSSRSWYLLILPAALAGPVLLILLPHISRMELTPWLTSHGLSGSGLLLMIPYFGLVHPILEQVHWQPLRRQYPLSHAFFAAYHVIVLWSLLELPWLIACFVILDGASLVWQRALGRTGGMLPVLISHMAADLGIVLAAYFLGCASEIVSGF